jgi:hypothetical protein
MSVLVRLLALCAVAFVLAPGTAVALEMPTGEPYANSVTARSMQVAVAFWHANPCPDGVTFLVARLQATSSTAAGAAPLERMNPAWGCTALLSPVIAYRYEGADYQDDIQECDTIVHWLGHVLGFDHDDDRSSVMFGGAITSTVMGCYRMFKPRRVSRARDRVLHERVWAHYPRPVPASF